MKAFVNILSVDSTSFQTDFSNDSFQKKRPRKEDLTQKIKHKAISSKPKRDRSATNVVGPSVIS